MHHLSDLRSDMVQMGIQTNSVSAESTNENMAYKKNRKSLAVAIHMTKCNVIVMIYKLFNHEYLFILTDNLSDMYILLCVD